MTAPNIKGFLSQSTYSTIYIPIIEKNTKNIFAYEALSNFIVKDKEVSCVDFFSRLHSNDKLFFLLEKKNKQHQINNAHSSHKLILHFDVVVFRKKEYRKYWKEYLEEFKNRIIISITTQSNLNQEDFLAKEKMIKWLIKNQYEFIINIFNDSLYSVCFEDIEKATFIRVHKQIIEKMENNNSYKKLLTSIINFAHINDTKTMIKHIDSKENLNSLDNFDFDYLQGGVII